MVSTSARIGFVALMVGAIAVIWIAMRGASELARFRSGDPTVWEAEIVAFEREAAESPLEAPVMLVGASSIRFWEGAAQDMAPLVVMRRGFGGAKLADVDYYAARLAAPPPRALVLSIGGNDLFEFAGSEAASSDDVAAKTRRLIEKFRALLPGVPIYYVSIRPPILDAQGRDPASQVNAQIRDFAAATQDIEYIDANAAMYDDRGELRAGLREWEGSALSSEGYAAWSAPIRERLLQDFGMLGEDSGEPASEPNDGSGD